MTVRFSPSFFRSISWAICLMFFMNVFPVAADEYLGPVFPEDFAVDEAFDEPLPLPKRNPLLQRPSARQVVFDDLDSDESLSQGLAYDGIIDSQPQSVRYRPIRTRTSQVHNLENVIFTDGTVPYDVGGECSAGDGCATGALPIAFGMGLFDNITVFGETTTFKTRLCEGAGSFGFSEGVNWSSAATPQGAVAVQYGLRGVQGDIHAPNIRSQIFMTAGLFKRFNLVPVQGGVAVDWLEDRTQHFGKVNLRQMRTELSYHPRRRNAEFGFLGGFNVFRDRPTTSLMEPEEAVDILDYDLLFARKHLDCGGQIELRCGSTSYGGFVMSTHCEVAISDRLAVNGGFTMLTPIGGEQILSSQRESWSMSLGIVLHFRGGAVCRSMNSYRPMFNVAGNDSLFTRIIGR
jgi:hypothetical protein